MKQIRSVSVLLLVLLAFGANAQVAPTQTISTIAGVYGGGGYSGDGGPATAALFYRPVFLVTDNAGNKYISDGNNNVVRKIDPSGIITTYAGTGASGYSGDGGAATSATLSGPNTIALDGAGNLYIATSNHVVRKVSAAGVISTFAGTGTAGYSGDGGAATSANLSNPYGVAVDGAGNVYISCDAVVRKVNTSGVISTVAGNGTAGYSGDGGSATSALLNRPNGIICDAAGNLFIADYSACVVRKVNTAGIISTVAGNGIPGHSGDGGLATSAQLSYPNTVAVDAQGNLYICLTSINLISKVNTAGIITSFAGTTEGGYSGDGGAATAARLFQPLGVSVGDSSRIYIVDSKNAVIRRVTAAVVDTTANAIPAFAGGTVQTLNTCAGSSIPSFYMYLAVADADAGQTEIWSVSAAPHHGTLSGVSAAATTTGGTITPPPGASYTPAAGYSGRDTMTIQVSDGHATAYTTIYVNINGTPSTITGTAQIIKDSTRVLSSTPSGGTWSSSNPTVASVNSVSGAVTGNAVGTATITYTVTNSCGIFSTTTIVTVATVFYCAPSYLYPGPSCSSGYSIAKFAIAGTPLNDTDACNGTTNYENNSAFSVALVPATVYTVGIAAGGSTPLSAQVWVDWNNNGTFETSESVGGIASFTNALPTPTFTINIPAGAPVGSHRMRVVSDYASCCGGAFYPSISPCATGVYYGDARDYTVVTNGPNHAPAFTGGANQSLTVCQNSTGNSINALLAVIDSDVAQAETWSVFSAASHGTVSATYSRSSTGNIITPAGLTYTPTSGYSGTDAFTIRISDGFQVANTTINVTVNPTSVAAIAGTATVTATGTTTLTDATPGGVWSSASPAFATVGSATGVVSGVATGTALISYTVSSSCGSFTATKVVTVTGLTYCAVSFTSASASCSSYGININRFAITGESGTSINDLTTCNGTTNYENNSASMFVTLGRGSTYGCNIKCSGPYSEGGQVWIDFNNNGTFESTESVGGVANFTSTLTPFNITIPTTAATGSHRMRVVGNYGVSYPSVTACGTGITYGDARDYTVTIVTVNHVPAFTGGSVQSFSVCPGASATSINSLLAVSDVDAGQTETWSVASGPSHGTLVAFYATTSTGGTLTPSGLTYTPAAGYTGADVFTVQISDGVSSSTSTVNVSVGTIVSPITGTTTVAVPATTTLSDATTGGTWTSSNPGSAIVNASGVVTGIAVGTAVISYSVTNSCGTYYATTIVTVTPPVYCSPSYLNASLACNPSYGLSIGRFAVTGNSGTGINDLTGCNGITNFENNTATMSVNLSGGNTYAANIATVGSYPLDAQVWIDFNDNAAFESTESVGGISGIINLLTPFNIAIPYGAAMGTHRMRLVTNYVCCGANPYPMMDPCAVNVYYGDARDYTVVIGPSNYTPAFTSGSSPNLFVCAGSGGNSINSLLSVSDIDTGQTETWSIVSGPSHGTLSGFSTTVVSTGATMTPAGLNYRPAAGYTGADVCVISVSDGIATVMTTVNILVGVINPVTGNTTIPVGYITQLSDATNGGAWSSSNPAVATVGSTGVVTGIATGTATITYSVATACGVMNANTMVSVVPFAVSPIITTYAGNHFPGYSGDGGAATSATLRGNQGVDMDAAGNLYIVDASNYVIRKVNTAGVITTIAGTGTSGYTGDGGPATAAKLGSLRGIAVDKLGNVFITDQNSVIRKINTSGIISTVVGNGASGYGGDGGPATAAMLSYPFGVAVDVAGNLYIADYYRIRKVSTSGIITTIAGNGSSGNSGDGGAAGSAVIGMPSDVDVDANGNVYFVDNNNVARKINTSGIISTVAGNGGYGYMGDGGPATSATLNVPYGITTDALGNIYITDLYNNVVRKVNASGIISTYAGTGAYGYTGDGGAANSATLNYPYSIAVDGAGSLYISDGNNNVVRKVSSTNSAIVTNHAPVFANGGGQTVSGCQSTSLNLNGALAVIDTDGGQTETWTVISGPSNGSLSGFVATAGSTGATVSPTGVYYTPATGFSGTDVFTIQVSDGIATATTTVTVSVTGVTPITGATNICANTTMTLSDATAGGVWASSNTSIASVNGTTGVVTGVNGGSVTLSYVLPSGCTATTGITIFAAPSAISGTAELCAGATVTLSDVTSGGVWISSNAGIATIGTSGALTGINAGTAIITYMSPTGCSATRMVTIDAAPAAITGSASICQGSSITLADVTAGGAWNSSTPSVASISPLFPGLVTGVAAGSAYISYTLSTGCSATMLVTVNAAPNAGTVSGASSLCVGSTISLDSPVSGGTWSSSNTAVATFVGTGANVQGVSAGTATISYTVSNSCGTAFATKIVTVNAAPTAGTITGGTAVAVGSTLTLSDSITGGSWNTSDKGIATVNSTGVVTAASAGSVTITYSVFNSCGYAYTTKPITVTGLSAFPITGVTEFCQGSTTSLSHVSAGGTWSSDNVAVATIGMATGAVTGMSAGTAGITYTTSTGVIAVKVVTVDPVPSAIAGGTVIEAGAADTLTNTYLGGMWMSSNASIASIDFTSGRMTGISAGTATISYMLFTGCYTTTNVTVNATSSPTVWYSDTTGGDASVLANWWSNSNNTGMHPTSFLHNGDTWVFQSYMSTSVTTMSFGGNISIVTNGTFIAPSGTVSVGGWWQNVGGVFTHNNGTVNFYGTDSLLYIQGSLTGTNCFHHLTFNGVGGRWSFGSYAVDVTGNFNIINGTVTAPTATIQIGGNYSNLGVFVHNGGTVVMNCTGAAAIAGNVTSATNSSFYNLVFNGSGSWVFSSTTVDVINNFNILLGTVTAPAGYLNIGLNYYNGGSFIHNNCTVTMKGGAACTIGGNMTGANRFYNLYFNGAGSWSFGSYAVHIANNFNIVSGTVIAPSTTLQIWGNYSNSGIFAHNGGSVVMSGTVTGLTLTGNMTLATGSGFNHLVFDGIGGAWSFANAVDLEGNFTLNNGTITNGPAVLNVLGDFNIYTGIFNCYTGGTIAVGGSWNNTGTFTANGCTVDMTGSGVGLSLGATTFYNLRFSGSGSWLCGVNPVTVVNDFTQVSGTFTAPSTTFTVGGNWLHTGGVFNHNHGTVILNSALVGLTLSTKLTGVTSGSFYHLIFDGGGSWTFNNHVDVEGDFTIISGTVNMLANINLTILGAMNNAGTLNPGAGCGMRVGTHWVNTGVFNASTCVVTMTGITSGLTLSGNMTGVNKFYLLAFDGIGGSWTFLNNIDVANHFRILNGTVTTSANHILNIYGDWYNAGYFFAGLNSVINVGSVDFGNWYATGGAFSANNCIVNLVGSGSLVCEGNMSGANKFNVLNFNNAAGEWSFGAHYVDVGSHFTIIAGHVIAPSTTLQIAGNFACGDRFTHNSGTVLMSCSGAATLTGNMTLATNCSFYNLIFNGTGSWIFGSAVVDVVNNFNIILGTVTAPSSNLYIGLNYNNSGSFIHNNCTVVMNGAGVGLLTGYMTGANRFYNLHCNGTGSWSCGGYAVDIENNFDILAGTFIAPSSIFTIGGNFHNLGVFTHNGGTVVLNGTVPGLTLSGNMTLATNSRFNHLVCMGVGAWSFLDPADCEGNFNLTDGTITCGPTLFNVFGNFYINSGIFHAHTAGGSTIYVGGNWLNNGSFYAHTCTVNMNGSGVGLTLRGSMTGLNSFYNLTCSGTGSWTCDNYYVDVFNDLIILSGEFTAPSTTIRIGGNYKNLGRFIHNNGLVHCFATTPGHTCSGSMTGINNRFNHLKFDGIGGVWTFNDDVDVFGDFNIINGTVIGVPSGTMHVFGNWYNGDLFTHNNCSVVMSGTATGLTLGGHLYAASQFYNLTFDGTGSWSFLSPIVTCYNNYTQIGGTVLLPTDTLKVGGHWNHSGGDCAHNHGTVHMTGACGCASNLSGLMTGTNSFYNLIFNSAVTGATWNFLNDIQTDNDFIICNRTVVAPLEGTIHIGGRYVNTGAFTHNNCTVRMIGNVPGLSLYGNMTLGTSSSFYNLVFNGAGSWTFGGAAVVDVVNNFNIMLGTVTAPSSNLYIGLNYNNSGSFIHNNCTVTMNGAGTGLLTGYMTGANRFYNLHCNGTGSWSCGGYAVDIEHNFDNLAGTFIAPSTFLTIGGNYHNLGVFTHNGGTVVLNGTVLGLTLSGNMTLATNSRFNHLVCTGVGGGWSFLDPTDAEGNFNLNDGTVTCGPTLFHVLGDFNINSGIYHAHTSGGSTIYVGGNWLNNGSFNAHTCTVNMNGSGVGLTLRGSMTALNGFYNLTCSGTGAWTCGGYYVDVFNDLIILSGEFTAPSTTLRIGGNYKNQGRFIHNNGLVHCFATTPGHTCSGSMTTATNRFNHLTFDGVGGEWLFNDDVEVFGDFNIINGHVTAVESGTIRVFGNWYNGDLFTHNNCSVVMSGTNTGLTLGGHMNGTSKFYNLTFNGSGSWSFLSPIVTAHNNYCQTGGTVLLPTDTLKVGGHWNHSGGTCMHNHGTVHMTGACGCASNLSGLMINENSFYNLIFNSGETGVTWNFLNDVQTENDFIICNRTVVGPSEGTIHIRGKYLNTGAFTHNNCTVNMIGTVPGLSLTGNMTLSTNSRFYHLTFNGVGGSWTLNNDVDVFGNFTITNGAVTAYTSGAIRVFGNWYNGGTFTHNNCTVFMSGTTPGLTLGGYLSGTSQFYNLSFNGSGTWTFLTPFVSVWNNYCQTGGDVTLPSDTLKVGGHWNHSAGVCNHNHGTVHMTGACGCASHLSGLMAGENKFYNLYFHSVESGVTWSLLGDVETENDLTICNHTVIAPPSGTISIGGNYTNTGVFTHNNCTVVFKGTRPGLLLRGNMTIATLSAFYHLIFDGVGGEWSFNAYAADVLGAFTITNGIVTAPSTSLTCAGHWTNNGTFIHNGGCVSLVGTVAQNIYGFTEFYNLVTNNGAGCTMFHDCSVANLLTMTAGVINIGVYNLTLGFAAHIAGVFSNTVMIIANLGGQVRKQMNAHCSFLFPIGDDMNNYTPITINFTGGTYGPGAYCGMNVKNAKHPHNANSNNCLKRYWSLGSYNITDVSYTITNCTYVPGDVVGWESRMSCGHYPNHTPWMKFGCADTLMHILSTPTLHSCSGDFTGITTQGPVVTINPAPAICAGGASPINATATGDSIVSYSWLPACTCSGAAVSVTPTVTTTYTVTVTDGNGFTGTTTTTVSVNPLPAAITGPSTVCSSMGTPTLSTTSTGGTWTSSNASVATICAGGMVTALAPGTTNITYTLSTGCAATSVLTVTAPVSFTVGGTVQGVSCNGGSNGGVVTSVSGGSPTYTYAWSNGAVTPNLSGAAPGTYSVLVTDAHSCTSVGSYTVTQPAVLTGSFVLDTTRKTASCPNGLILFGYDSDIATSASGGTAPYSYAWGAGTSGCGTCATASLTSAQTIYSVTITDANGCATVVSTSCGRDVTCTAGKSPQHKLIICHNGHELCVDSSAVSAHLSIGDKIGPCTMAKGGATVGGGMGLELTAYPNPFTDELSVKVVSTQSERVDVMVYDVAGRVLETHEQQDINGEMTVGKDLIPGIYIVEVRQGAASVRVKVVKY